MFVCWFDFDVVVDDFLEGDGEFYVVFASSGFYVKLVVDCADGVLFAVCFSVYIAFFGVFEEFEEFTREDFELFSGVVSCADSVYCGEFLQFDDSLCVD